MSGMVLRSALMEEDGITPMVTGGESDPTLKQFAAGSFTVATGTFRIIAHELVLTGADEATLVGTGLLRII